MIFRQDHENCDITFETLFAIFVRSWKKLSLNEKIIDETNFYFEYLQKSYLLYPLKKLDKLRVTFIELKGGYVKK